MKNTLYIPPPEALFRCNIVSQVLGREIIGESRSEAVKTMAASMHVSYDGQPRKVVARTIYRWIAAYEADGIEGLMPKVHNNCDNLKLPTSLLDFFKEQKIMDPQASIPELIKRAKLLNMKGSAKANRVTVWRNLNSMGVDTAPRKSIRKRDARRFAYPHRMNMMICDGKHFRAGIGRLRRVALFFLDDATRKALDVVVGTSENAHLFLHGMHKVFSKYGLPNAIYVDNGPGFIANDVIAVAGKLGIPLIHGEAAYPEGHGKIEKFNRTAKAQVLRYLDGNPEVDAKCSALELRLRHYIFEQYDRDPHESLDGETPWNRFHNDSRKLVFAKSQEELQKAYVLHDKRRVSYDNIISFGNIDYEVPRGYAGSKITLYRNLLDDEISIVHQERLVKLSQVDLHINARTKRVKPPKKEKEICQPLPKGSAQIAFEKDYKPVVDGDGNFKNSNKENDS